MATLNTDIRYIKGVGEARAKSLAKLGITDLRSLLSYFPRAYDDRRAYKKIAGLIPGENACVCAVIAGEPRLSRIRKGLDLIKLRAVDETGALELTYFNQSYLKNTFHTGDAYVFFGRAEGTPSRPQMTNPLFEREPPRRPRKRSQKPRMRKRKSRRARRTARPRTSLPRSAAKSALPCRNWPPTPASRSLSRLWSRCRSTVPRCLLTPAPST